MSYTSNAAELLKRRKVHRDVIFRYLAKEGVVMPPASDKHQLVQRTLELWTSAQVRADSTDRYTYSSFMLGPLTLCGYLFLIAVFNGLCESVVILTRW